MSLADLPAPDAVLRLGYILAIGQYSSSRCTTSVYPWKIARDMGWVPALVWAVGSAPAFKRHPVTRTCPFCTATSKGVTPSLLCLFTSALAATSNSTASEKPSNEAT